MKTKFNSCFEKQFLSGTFDEIPPIFIAILGGVFQQIVGPKKMLLVSAVASILSWMFIVVSTRSTICLLMSRACAGFAQALLIGNVYLAGVVRHKFLGPFKMIEVVLLLIERFSLV